MGGTFPSYPASNWSYNGLKTRGAGGKGAEVLQEAVNYRLLEDIFVGCLLLRQGLKADETFLEMLV